MTTGEPTMTLTLPIHLEADCFDTSQAELAGRTAQQKSMEIYSWKTSGKSNWLEKGFQRSDVLNLVLLPQGLPGTIDMPDDR